MSIIGIIILVIGIILLIISIILLIMGHNRKAGDSIVDVQNKHSQRIVGWILLAFGILMIVGGGIMIFYKPKVQYVMPPQMVIPQQNMYPQTLIE